MSIKKIQVLFILLSACIAIANAQENSPYTRFGMGELKPGTSTFLMGSGQTAAYQDLNHLNFVNPASYASLKLTTFDIGFYGSFLKLKTTTQKSSTGNSSVNYFALGFPIIRDDQKKLRWGAGFGLLPYSSIGYSAIQTNYNQNGIDTSINKYIGSGRVYQAFAGTGVKIKNLSLGFNFKYLFGQQNYADTWELPDTLNAFNSYKQETRYLNDGMLDFGLQYAIPVMKDSVHKKFDIILGLNGNLSAKIHARQDLLFENFVYTSTGFTPKDTFYNIKGHNGDIELPMQINGGLMLRKENDFMIGINYKFAQWSKYRAFDQPDSTVNSYRIGVGGEWIPNKPDGESYFNLVSYRFGVYYGTSYLRLGNSTFNEMGLTGGFGFPLKRVKFNDQLRVVSEFNISLDAGQRGTVENNLIKENYYRIFFGLSVSDLWFVKRKYD